MISTDAIPQERIGSGLHLSETVSVYRACLIHYLFGPLSKVLIFACI